MVFRESTQTVAMRNYPHLLFCKFFKRPDCIFEGLASSGKMGWLYGRGGGQLFALLDEASIGSACGVVAGRTTGLRWLWAARGGACWGAWVAGRCGGSGGRGGMSRRHVASGSALSRALAALHAMIATALELLGSRSRAAKR